MEKIISLAGREFKQKASAKNVIIYRATFGEDIAKAFALFQGSGSNGQVIIERLDVVRMMRLVWTMQKTADAETPSFEEWVDDIEYFPLFEAYNQIVELITINVTGITTIKNANTAVESSQPKG